MAPLSAMEKLHTMVAPSAIHDGKRGKEDYTDVCHPGTREEYLENLKAWADRAPAEMRVQWANAIAGAGKTAMMRTFCSLLEDRRGFPPISFFIWKNDLARNTLDRFPATIAAQLCRRIPALVPYVEKAINEDFFLLQSSFKKQMDKLVISPLLDACDAIKGENHLIFVVDGLDELDEQSQIVLLNFIPDFLSRVSSLPISLLVSSRPDPDIVGAFQHPKLASITKAMRLGASDEDIWKFLNDKFEEINLRHPYLQIEHGGKWPSQLKREIMVKQSSGLFIWPTVAIDYIDKVKLGLGHNKRLEQILSSAEPKPWIASPLDNLYRAILQAHAPEDPEELLRFKRRLALLCLPVNLGHFVWELLLIETFDWSNTAVGAVFDETIDELWGSVAGLSSLFLPRETPSEEESPTPSISHRSFRDFTFNRARCGEQFYHSSEQALHTEVVCKFIKFFNNRTAYQSCAEMSAEFIDRAGKFLESHLKDAAVSEALGRCMDDMMLDAIPPTWPLVSQVFTIVRLFNGLYRLAENPNFPEGSQHRDSFLCKLVVYFKSRIRTAEEWDAALFRLALSTTDFHSGVEAYHSVQCWHVARSPQCTCIDAYARNLSFGYHQTTLRNSTLFQHSKSRLAESRQDDVEKGSLNVLQFMVSLCEKSQRASELSSFIPVVDYWIDILLKHCPPSNDLYNTLGPICTAPLPDSQTRDEELDDTVLVHEFLGQTDAFNEYTQRCREAGIEKNFPPIDIPDDWWQTEEIQMILLHRGYIPPSNIPGRWWTFRKTRDILLEQGYEQPTVPTVRVSAARRVGGPRTCLESDSLSVVSAADPRSLSSSPSNPPSVAPSYSVNSAIILDAPAGDVDDVQRVQLPNPPHVGPICVPAIDVIASEANGTASDVEDAQEVQSIILPPPVAYSAPILNPVSLEQTTVSGTNGMVSEVGGQPLGQRRRGGVRRFFGRFFRQ